ncbi:hypothetical protein C2G38_2154317 [Gigaspora rosea]|uniref:Uncharacterized protein n=1 Tax=Gigaspora rosea TaxID=44941 RepID=A0A397WCH9_9GLOM|nr:hypothetical protein C2G38_2154317 [Gigaspora rosea]
MFQGLIKKLLQLLSEVINKYLETNYLALYFKIKSLNLGPNVPKPFICPLGRFEDSKLVFPELKLVVHVIAFYSNLLVYENLPITTRV